MDTLTARLTSLELQPQIWQSGPTGDAGPPGRSPDSPSEGGTTEGNTIPPEPMETNGTPGESLGSLPAAWTEPKEGEETLRRSFDSPPEGQAEQQTSEENFNPTEPRDPVEVLEKSFGSLSVEPEERDRSQLPRNAHRRRKPRGGASRKNSYLQCVHQAGG